MGSRSLHEDSDGDGRSNGIELGDPNCSWVEGMDPTMPELSHLGMINEPKDEPTRSTRETYEALGEVISIN